ncbi:mechanosensitive ion channel family protein [Flammeovirgaceae bacterium SG7u.111]|nr:mechanosensitive ion channel family protein [Flammeovirgaceae bacterium SG7u.132]WPO34357.1 mechanosensitive ion channel family protein [Flammeovirgaceae bacterium SG7u.111]
MTADLQKSYDLLIGKLQNWGETGISMLPNLVVSVLVLLLFAYLARVLRNVTNKLISKTSWNDIIRNLLSTIVFVTVIIVGVFVALGTLQLDKTVSSLLAGAGIVGLGLTLAFRELASDFIAGITLAIRQPFKVGDVIEIQGHMGTVEGVNLRTTNVKTFQGQRVLIPNSETVNNSIVNYSAFGRRRIDMDIGVSYGDDLRKAREVIWKAIRELPYVKSDEDVMAHFMKFGDSSIILTLRLWIDFPVDNPGYLDACNDMVITVKETLDANDITIPFPIRTLDFGAKGGEKLSDMELSLDGNNGHYN